MGRTLNFVKRRSFRVPAPKIIILAYVFRGFEPAKVATWHQNAKPFQYGVCLTDVSLEKRKVGKTSVKPRPCVQKGKSGAGREELKCPRGLPAPWSGDAGRSQLLWARLVAWLFCKKPRKLTLKSFFSKGPDGKPLWVVDHLGGGPHDSRVRKLEIVTREERIVFRSEKNRNVFMFAYYSGQELQKLRVYNRFSFNESSGFS